jgi:hypothetical protein
LASSKSTNVEYRQKLVRLEQTNDTLEGKIREAKFSIEQLEQQLKEVREQIDNLNDEIIEKDQLATTEKDRLLEENQRLKDRLRDNCEDLRVDPMTKFTKFAPMKAEKMLQQKQPEPEHFRNKFVNGEHFNSKYPISMPHQNNTRRATFATALTKVHYRNDRNVLESKTVKAADLTHISLSLKRSINSRNDDALKLSSKSITIKKSKLNANKSAWRP